MGPLQDISAAAATAAETGGAVKPVVTAKLYPLTMNVG